MDPAGVRPEEVEVQADVVLHWRLGRPGLTSAPVEAEEVDVQVERYFHTMMLKADLGALRFQFD